MPVLRLWFIASVVQNQQCWREARYGTAGDSPFPGETVRRINRIAAIVACTDLPGVAVWLDHDRMEVDAPIPLIHQD